MTFTYLIGNGFDLGMRLKTDYQSFMDWYLAKPANDPEMNWVRQDMRNHPNRWSDAEIAFGKLSFSKYGKSAIDVFNKCYDGFTDAFISYLVKRNKLFDIPALERQKVSRDFLHNVICVQEYLSPRCRQHYFEWLNESSIDVNFITFNYTDTLEQILDFHQGQSNEHVIPFIDNKTLKVVVRNICHVHGTLDDAYVFGIDSPEQIADTEVRNYCQRNGGMLKARADEKLGLLNRTRGIDIIRQSNRIVTYGLSFGKSDTSWWKILHNVVFNGSVQLLICPFRADLPERLGAKKRGDIYLEEKRRVFDSLLASDRNLAVKIEEVNPPNIMSLRPSKVPDGSGNLHPCDYFHLSELADKYTKVKN